MAISYRSSPGTMIGCHGDCVCVSHALTHTHTHTHTHSCCDQVSVSCFVARRCIFIAPTCSWILMRMFMFTHIHERDCSCGNISVLQDFNVPTCDLFVSTFVYMQSVNYSPVGRTKYQEHLTRWQPVRGRRWFNPQKIFLTDVLLRVT